MAVKSYNREPDIVVEGEREEKVGAVPYSDGKVASYVIPERGGTEQVALSCCGIMEVLKGWGRLSPPKYQNNPNSRAFYR